MIYYIRNEVDGLIGFEYNNDKYYYIKNAQNDIIGILDSSYNVVAKYTYDAWGNIISIKDGNGLDVSNDTTHIANINPFRYRSYYYDKETNLYYLNSRYYNPVWGRFINADGLFGNNIETYRYNLYMYANNNMIMFSDLDGQNPFVNLATNFFDTTKKITQEFVEVVDLKNNLETVGFMDTTYSNAKQLNRTLHQNNIETPEQKSHFLAQCAYETNFGMWLTEIGSEQYFSTKAYGYKYRGAGYIQLTWSYNYESFSKAMGDPEIYNQGADYVAANYAWDAAGWFWTNKKMNDRISNGATVKDITRLVKGSTSTWEERQEYYNKIYSVFK